jgi:WhiB family redox-sensing transcriptional regulator
MRYRTTTAIPAGIIEAAVALRDGSVANWWELGKCRDIDTAIFFSEDGASDSYAKEICAVCPVKTVCLAYALFNNERFGIWGGTTAHERRQWQIELAGIAAGWWRKVGRGH